jgi:cytochrome c biogenesis protein CcdA
MIFTIAPLVQAADTKRRWLTTLGTFTGWLVLVLGLFGAGMAWAGSSAAATVTTPRAREVIASLALTALGIAALAIALGELGITRRLLPAGTAAPPGATSTRRPMLVAVTFGATMAIFSPLAAYALVIGWVAAQQSAWLGAVTLMAYGLGLVTPLAIAGSLASGRALVTRVAGLQDRVALVSGVAMAVTGGFLLSMWALRATWALFIS